MNSSLRTLLIVALVVAFVAAVTIITQFSTTQDKRQSAGGTDSDPTALVDSPIEFRDSELKYDPESETSISYRSFSGFYELGNTVNWQSFWFQHKHPFPVRITLPYRSCSSCTSAKLAIIPNELVQRQAMFVAASGFPMLPVPMPDLLSPIGYAELNNKLTWHTYNFEKGDDAFAIPAAESGRPTIGILALGFSAKAVGPPTEVTVGAETIAPGDRFHRHKFSVTYAQRPPFDIAGGDFQLGDLPEGTPSRTVDVFIYSSTRNPSRFPPPTGRVEGDDARIEVGKAVPLTNDEVEQLIRRAKTEAKLSLRVQSGYRIPVTIRPDLPGKAADIGKFERMITFSSEGTNHTANATLRGRVTGLVEIESGEKDKGEKIDLGSYNSSTTTKRSYTIYSRRTDLDLQIDPVNCSPAFVQYSLEPPTLTEGRKYWKVVVLIPPGVGRKPAWEGVVYLRAKGSNNTQATIRLPVTGNGIGR